MSGESPFKAAHERYGDHQLLSAAEELALARAVRRGGPEGERARERLVMQNMRLVLSEARHWERKSGVEFDDLVQVGALGLMHAIEKFDPERGFKLSTYATLWIRQAIQRATASQSDTIRLPSETRRIRIHAYNNPDLSAEQIAVELEQSVPKVRTALAAGHVVKSIDQQVAFDGEQTVAIEQLADVHADDPAALSDDVAVSALLDTLSDVERQVVELAYGLNGYGGQEHTRPEIAARLKLSAADVKRLQLQAMKRLRQAAAA